jgi:hypothetical protein
VPERRNPVPSPAETLLNPTIDASEKPREKPAFMIGTAGACAASEAAKMERPTAKVEVRTKPAYLRIAKLIPIPL